ncbi:hypothetical protein PAGU2196_25040 [Pseudomonas sp. PAGU 2196]|uniref:hypothetical protein n=1 Tax=Pseudomonas sp. PAGU 2196 TaxID=2793997 RepID=UPI001EE0F1AC|nr:hypothetical protein [Pseudomonas sp. PAGU 2196]GHS81670.1 hypothetical protein PAGU2196_25040 [Pseudomonas sp. PAGU 2196]
MKLMRIMAIALLALYLSPSAYAGWKCDDMYSETFNPDECSDVGTRETPEAFIAAFAESLEAHNTNANRTDWKPGACTVYADTANCSYTWIIFNTATQTNTVSLIKEQTQSSCAETIELSSADKAVTKSSSGNFVQWTVREVPTEICHDSCSYLGESAAKSDCAFVKGSTDTGFCNYFVGLNTANPTCTSDSGYSAPRTGDPLNGKPGTGGDGGSDGGDDGDDGSNTGGGNTGGDDDSGSDFDGELSFESPGELDADSILEDEQNPLAAETFVNHMQTSFADSQFGQAVADFNMNIISNIGNGTCPQPVVDVGFAIVRFESHCELLNSSNVVGILSIVFLAGWSLLAVRIVLSA